MAPTPPRESRRWRPINRLDRLLRRLGFTDYTLLLVAAAGVGLATGIAVLFFRATYEGITGLALGGDGHAVMDVLTHAPWWQVLAVPTAGGLVVGSLQRWWGSSEDHGVASVIHAVGHREGRIPLPATVRSFLSNSLSIGTGASLGPEGPVIELGSGLGSGIASGLKASPQKARTLVGCGAAAGLAAAFNAPIAGAIFALEIVLRDFAASTFSPIIVAAVIATALSRRFLGDAPTFEVPAYELTTPWELPLYLVLGLAAGLLAVGFTRLVHTSETQITARVRLPRPLLTAAGGLLLGCAFLGGFPHLFGVGYEPSSALLNGQVSLRLMAGLLVLKMLASALSLGTGFTGGLFAPSLLIGGALGGLIGALADQIFPGHGTVGMFSLIGMAAFMAAMTHAPITSILILFEMTGGYEVILPLMLSCISAVLVAQALSPDSMFTMGLRRRGVDVNYGRESAILRGFYAEDIMHSSVPTVNQATPLREIVELFLEQNENHYFVVDEEGTLRGEIGIHDIKDVLQETGLGHVVIAADLMQPVIYQVQRRENLQDTMMLLSGAEQDELPVVDSADNPKLAGMVSRRDILELYNREILGKEVLGIKMVHTDSGSRDFVNLPDEYQVELLPVTPDLEGRTLAELDLRGRFGLHILAIKRPGRRVEGRNELPDPTVPLTARDRLIVVGQTDAVERFRAGEIEGAAGD